MREIKFRAWDKIGNKMKFITDSNSLYLKNNRVFNIYEFEEFNIIRIRNTDVTERYEIMQYTGMIDENGQDVYEGDIVRYYEFNEETEELVNMGIGEVYFDDNYECNYTIRGEEPNSLGRYMLKVIGNIYENKELL